MNEFRKTPEGVEMQGKASDIAQFLKEKLNGMGEVELIALYQQIGIKDDSHDSELLALAMEETNYIAMPAVDKQRVDDLVQSLRSAIDGEEN